MTQDRKKQIQERIDKLMARNNGRITPDMIVKDAESPSSPLHDQFEWDNAAAAHQHRLQQARELLGRFKVEVRTIHRTFMAPAYIRDPHAEPDGQGYTTIAKIRDDKDAAADAIEYEFSRAIACMERAVDIAESLGMGDKVRDLMAQMKALHGEVLAKRGSRDRGWPGEAWTGKFWLANQGVDW